ncbi:MAG: GMC oxidoreductase [Bacteroidota bacterium]
MNNSFDYIVIGGGTTGPVMAVVNTKFQVRGIKNLRVADASVIPNLISGHTRYYLKKLEMTFRLS